MNRYLWLLAVPVVLLVSCKKERDTTKIQDTTVNQVFNNGPTDSLKINQIQVIGSHNSYHLKTDSALFAWLTQVDSLGYLPSKYSPKGLDYWHLPVEQQFDNYNIRGLEIDFYNDPQGGLFYFRRGLNLIGDSTSASGIAELNQPGFKVLHIPDFDFNTNYITFKDALRTILNWSNAHPNHLPIFINIETKEETIADALPALPNLTHAIPFDADACDKIDLEIKSVFGDNLDKVITPDKVRGNYSTLEQAVLAGNWPTLAAARNKVIFIMQGTAQNIYAVGRPSLQGRAMFTYADPGTPEAAFVILNSPTSDKTQIQQRVAQGYIVRTRADADTKQARNGSTTDRENAFTSGAQIVSTDYYRPDPRYLIPNSGWTDYHVQFPNGELARINPVSAADKQNLGTIKE